MIYDIVTRDNSYRIVVAGSDLSIVRVVLLDVGQSGGRYILCNCPHGAHKNVYVDCGQEANNARLIDDFEDFESRHCKFTRN